MKLKKSLIFFVLCSVNANCSAFDLWQSGARWAEAIQDWLVSVDWSPWKVIKPSEPTPEAKHDSVAGLPNHGRSDLYKRVLLGLDERLNALEPIAAGTQKRLGEITFTDMPRTGDLLDTINHIKPWAQVNLEKTYKPLSVEDFDQKSYGIVETDEILVEVNNRLCFIQAFLNDAAVLADAALLPLGSEDKKWFNFLRKKYIYLRYKYNGLVKQLLEKIVSHYERTRKKAPWNCLDVLESSDLGRVLKISKYQREKKLAVATAGVQEVESLFNATKSAMENRFSFYEKIVSPAIFMPQRNAMNDLLIAFGEQCAALKRRYDIIMHTLQTQQISPKSLTPPTPLLAAKVAKEKPIDLKEAVAKPLARPTRPLTVYGSKHVPTRAYIFNGITNGIEERLNALQQVVTGDDRYLQAELPPLPSDELLLDSIHRVPLWTQVSLANAYKPLPTKKLIGIDLVLVEVHNRLRFIDALLNNPMVQADAVALGRGDDQAWFDFIGKEYAYLSSRYNWLAVQLFQRIVIKSKETIHSAPWHCLRSWNPSFWEDLAQKPAFETTQEDLDTARAGLQEVGRILNEVEQTLSKRIALFKPLVVPAVFTQIDENMTSFLKKKKKEFDLLKNNYYVIELRFKAENMPSAVDDD